MLGVLLTKLREYFAPNQRFGVRTGRLFGIEIWWHWWLLVVILLQLLYFLLRAENYPRPLGHWIVFLMTLPMSVLLHELFHAYMAARVAGRAKRLVLSPVGGLVPCEVPSEPNAQLWVAASGPVANILLLVVSGAVCLSAGWTFLPAPGQSQEFLAHRLFFQSLFLWNGFLLIVNAVPCYPMDAGRMLQMVLWSRRESYHEASTITLKISRVMAIACIFVGISLLVVALGNEDFALEYPLANHLIMGLLIVAFLHFYEARKLQLQLAYGPESQHDEEEEDRIFGYDFSQGYTSLDKTFPAVEEDSPGYLERRRDKARRQKEAQRRQEDRELRERVDELLVKIHQCGIKSLSHEEQHFLEWASKHFRNSPTSRDSQRS